MPVQAPAAKPKPVKRTALRAPEPEREHPPAAPLVLAQAPRPPLAEPAYVQPRCLDCGIVEAVREIEQKGEGSWIGPVAGGIGGAILPERA